MGKKTVFTNITPLPPNVSREVAIAMLHNHDEMIELNPLVIEHHPVKTPRDAPKDEFLDCAWHEMTDRISYLPGGIVKGKVTYKGCFHDLPNGLQTHVYAPMSLDIREKWTVGGTLPGEPEEPRELGLNLPRRGLYLREDGEMKCNMLMSSFVRKNLDNSHKVLVERILAKAERVQAHLNSQTNSPSETSSLRGGSGMIPPFQPGSHMGNSNLARQISSTPTSSTNVNSFSNRPEQPRTSSDSAAVQAVRTQLSGRNHHNLVQELPASQPGNLDGSIQPQTLAAGDPEEIHVVHPALRDQYRQHLAQSANQSNASLPGQGYPGGQAKNKPFPPTGKSFAVELEGSRPESSSSHASRPNTAKQIGPVEMDGGYTGTPTSMYSSPSGGRLPNGHNIDGSISELSTQTADRDIMPRGLNLAHMRSYSQPLIEADTYISSASAAHNMEPASASISAHPAVSGVGGQIAQSRFRGLSNGEITAMKPDMHPNPNTSTNTNTNMISNHNYNHFISPVDEPSNNNPDRFSMVSEISDMPTPKAGQYGFGTGAVNDRFSVVSALTDGVPTPRMPSAGFAEQEQQRTTQESYVAREREREREMLRRNYI